jgi:hypothetical protein
MQDLTLYYLFLKCNLMHYYFDKILSFVKMGVTNLPPYRNLAPEIQEALGNNLG